MTLIDERPKPQRRDDDDTPLVCDCATPDVAPIGGLLGPVPCCTRCHRPTAPDLEAWLTRPGGPRA
jgi:hypothetical protein